MPTDDLIKEELKQIYNDTVDEFLAMEGTWEKHDISEDYGEARPVYAARDTDYLQDLSAIFDADAFDDLSNAHQHAGDIDYYFADLRDNQGRKALGIKKGTQLKTTLRARRKLMRIVTADDTLKMVEDDVLKLDKEFDAIVTSDYVFMRNIRAVEYLADIVTHVTGAAASKVQHVNNMVNFLDLSRIAGDISRHRRKAKLAASIAARSDLSQIRQDRVQEIAQLQGVKFKTLDDGRLQPRRQDETKLLEILDDRRYDMDLTAAGPVPYRATGRQRVNS